MSDYQPIYTITPEILNLVYGIAKDLERIDIIKEQTLTPKLCRENRIRNIHSSLWIEANTLTLEQVTDVINGKKVNAPEKDILEAKNAYLAYQRLLDCDPYSVKDLLEQHRILMDSLKPDFGRFRDGNVGVFAGKIPIHVAPQAALVPDLMNNLMNWAKNIELPQIVKSCIFHYEFEFIHPFSDGNGRMGRMWQTLLLYQENTIFGWLPVEELVAENQQRYYNAINESTTKNDSAIFAKFMLELISKAVKNLKQQQDEKKNVGVNVGQNVGVKYEIIEAIKQNPHITAKELAAALDKTQRTIERHIKDLKEHGKLIRVGSDKTGYWEVAI